MLLSLSFVVGEEEQSDADWIDEDDSEEGDTRTFDVNEEVSDGDSPLFLTCRSGNLETDEILVVAGADVRRRKRSRRQSTTGRGQSRAR
jgi:hypothetical protein